MLSGDVFHYHSRITKPPKGKFSISSPPLIYVYLTTFINPVTLIFRRLRHFAIPVWLRPREGVATLQAPTFI